MKNFKSTLLSIIKKILDFISVVLILLTVIGGVMSIFYGELSTLFDMIGIPQERLVWLTVTLGSIGTVGVILTRVSGGLKQAIQLAQLNQQTEQRDYERELNERINAIKAESEAQIKSIESKTLADVKALTSEITTVKQELRKANEFNSLQAKKYMAAPDRIIDADIKDEYRKFIEKKV